MMGHYEFEEYLNSGLIRPKQSIDISEELWE